MKKLILSLTLVASFGQVLIIDPYRFGNPAQGSLLFAENFEGANLPVPNCYDSAGWTSAGGGAAIYTKDITTPACGTASLQIYGGSDGQWTYSYHSLSGSQTLVYFHVRMKIGALPAADAQFVKIGTHLNTTENSGYYRLSVTSTGALKIVSNAANVSTTDTISANTYYHIWGKYDSATQTGYVKFSLTSTEPANSGNNFISYSGGDSSAATYFHLTSRGPNTHYWDTVRVRTGTVGDIDCN